MNFYLSGTIVRAFDPLDTVIENIYLDATNLVKGFNLRHS